MRVFLLGLSNEGTSEDGAPAVSRDAGCHLVAGRALSKSGRDSRLRPSPAVRAPVLERLKPEHWRGALPPFVCVAWRGVGTPADLFQRVIASLTRSRRRSAHEKLGIEGPSTVGQRQGLLYVRIYRLAGSMKV